MKEKAKQKLSEAIEDQPRQNAKKYPFTKTPDNLIDGHTTSETILLPKKKNLSYEEIVSTKRIDIPKCKKIPINGRLYVVEVSGSESKTEAGIIIPHKYRSKKGEDIEIRDVSRYHVVAWDKDEIPPKICEKLHEGIEVSVFMPQEAEDFKLPVIVDFETSNEFLVLHYTELAGISETIPEIVEK